MFDDINMTLWSATDKRGFHMRLGRLQAARIAAQLPE